MCWQCDHPGSTRLDYLEHLHELIACHGWAVQGVQRDRVHPPWAYTVGLTSNGRPELVRSYGQLGRLLGVDLVFCCGGQVCCGYFKVSGTGAPMRAKASRWVLVGSASIGTVMLVPANRTWLRVKVARCCRRPRKLR